MPALTTHGKPVELNAVEVLRQADHIAAVYGRTPGETVAVTEWLLGLAYAADVYPETATEWRTWVENRKPLAEVADWLETHDGCWDLFDPVAPLGQNPALHPHLNQYGVGPAQLVMEQAGDYNQFFSREHLHSPTILPAAEAWRAMLTQHAYAIGMKAKIKTKDMGLPAPFANLSSARLVSRLRVIARPAWEGATFGDLLRLNLTPSGQEPGHLNLTWKQPAGPVRRDFTRRGAEQTRTPSGPADLHTVLGRSIALRPAALPDGTAGVDRVLIGPGETLGDLPAVFLQDAVTVDQGLLRPSLTRDLWRQSHSLYAAVAERDKGTDLYGRIAMLHGRRIHLVAVGLLATQGKLVSWVADEYPYVPGRETELRHAAEQGSAICEHAAKGLYAAAATAQTYAYPNPNPADKPDQIARFNGATEMWGAAADLFHTLMDDVADDTPAVEALAAFGTELRAVAVDSLDARLASLPTAGNGLEAQARARARLTEYLNQPKAPVHLKDPS
ncbi:type I-E CRISPR-associated protein Cse1/CasA [Streptomyces nojiriensis]|uniref:type I-E CRISPR-associated protein Cse1/CasA n=1 Tax=Streptomyces nojiriensis TaxID=66374 RepID=UPI0035DF04F8